MQIQMAWTDSRVNSHGLIVVGQEVNETNLLLLRSS